MAKLQIQAASRAALSFSLSQPLKLCPLPSRGHKLNRIIKPTIEGQLSSSTCLTVTECVYRVDGHYFVFHLYLITFALLLFLFFVIRLSRGISLNSRFHIPVTLDRYAVY